MNKHLWISIYCNAKKVIEELLTNLRLQYHMDDTSVIQDCEYDKIKKLAQDFYEYEEPVGTSGLHRDERRWNETQVKRLMDFIYDIHNLLAKYVPDDFDPSSKRYYSQWTVKK